MRRTLALVLLVLAAPLVAFPIVSPPADPPDRLSHSVSPSDAPADPDRVQGIEMVEYENLSERGRELFDAAQSQPGREPYTVDAGTGARDFDYGSPQAVLVVKGGETYRLRTLERTTLPDGQAVLLRLASLVLGIVAAALGGYWRLNADG